MHGWNFASCSLNWGNKVGCASVDPGLIEWVPRVSQERDRKLDERRATSSEGCSSIGRLQPLNLSDILGNKPHHVPSPHQGTEDLQLRWQVVQESAQLHAIKLASAGVGLGSSRWALKSYIVSFPQKNPSQQTEPGLRTQSRPLTPYPAHSMIFDRLIPPK